MNENVKRMIDQLKGIWKGMDFSARFISFVLLIGAVVGIVIWAFWINKEEYGLLYSGMEQKESAQILNYLREGDIPYQIKDGGKSIYIPSDRIYEVRLNLAGEGIPQGKMGFEIFDEVKFGATTFTQKVNYRRALQGELARTISQLDPVEWASVQVVTPEESLFVEEEKPTTASVVLGLKGHRLLTSQQVAGIVQLVSSSVEGLKPENVTITDNLGNLLTVQESSPMASKNNEQLELKRRIEEYYISKANDILSSVLGHGRAVVKVSADMEFRDVDEKHVIFDPERKVPRTQRIITRVSGGTPRIGGAPGAESNIKQVSLVQEIGSDEEEETIQTQYDVSKVERLISEHAGVIRSLSVAVLVDGKYETVMEDGKEIRRYIPLPEVILNNIGALVRNALGVKAERGDSFEIKNLQFHSGPDAGVVIKTKETSPIIKMLIDNSSLIITVFSFILFAMFILRRLRGRAIVETQKMRLLPTGKPHLAKDVEGIDIEAEAKAEAQAVLSEKDLHARKEKLKEELLKGTAMRELLKRPGKETNQELELFKKDIRNQVKERIDNATVILKRWLSK